MSKSKAHQQQAYQRIEAVFYALFDELNEQGVGLQEFVTLAMLALADSFRAVATEKYGIEYRSKY